MKLEKLDLNLLVVLECLLETQSVSFTAERLNVSQPTISAALKRLRDYFDDELLIQVGRTMLPTSKGEELAPAVTELLDIARFKIVKSGLFEPSTSARRFRISASDYVFDILLAPVIRSISQLAPQIEFEVLPIAPEMTRQFEKANIDLLITVPQFIFEGHPSKALFSDEDQVIAWNQGRYANGLSTRQFKQADFAAVRFGEELRPAVSDMHFDALGLHRKISMQVPSFSALPAAVVGTDRLAVMHRRHAEFFKSWYPISLHPLPVEGHETHEVAQWHRLRENDGGILWLLDKLKSAADALSQ